MAGAARHIDPVVRVTGVDKDLVILLVPGVHLVPVESDVVPERLEAWPRIRVGPGCLLRPPLPCHDIEAGSPVLRRPGRARGADMLARDVGLRKPVDGQPLRLEREQDVAGVGDRNAVEVHPHPAGRRLHPGAFDNPSWGIQDVPVLDPLRHRSS